MHFDGETYEPKHDHERLSSQLQGVRSLMLDGEWRTLEAISRVVPGSVAGISARLRDLRKPKFGALLVDRRRMRGGTFEYRVRQERK